MNAYNATLHWFSGLALAAAAGCAAPQVLKTETSPGAPQSTAGSFVQHGTMHEAIGMQQHHGRVAIADVARKPHFFGVAALEGLAGEVTIYDGEVIATRVNATGGLEPAAPDGKATLLAGAYVAEWSDHPVAEALDVDRLDAFVAEHADKNGVNVTQPFAFQVTGTFKNVRLHVINGACPVRARMRKEQLPDDMLPFEGELATVTGTVVGIYAKDAVGSLTHPGTATHNHLIYVEPGSGKKVTGHIEAISVAQGAVLRLPN